ncbi:MAG: translation initiation factor [Muribaculaceae bacterium]|nr:translation initiation factor [Muribaculaceae bacterium]
MMMNEDWKAALGAAFNYNPDEATHETNEEPTDASADALAEQGKQMLNVMFDKRNRNGKRVTLVTDFVGSDEALKSLAKELKQHCGVGGSARGGEILIQGDFRDKVLAFLKAKGFKARII